MIFGTVAAAHLQQLARRGRDQPRNGSEPCGGREDPQEPLSGQRRIWQRSSWRDVEVARQKFEQQPVERERVAEPMRGDISYVVIGRTRQNEHTYRKIAGTRERTLEAGFCVLGQDLQI